MDGKNCPCVRDLAQLCLAHAGSSSVTNLQAHLTSKAWLRKRKGFEESKVLVLAWDLTIEDSILEKDITVWSLVLVLPLPQDSNRLTKLEEGELEKEFFCFTTKAETKRVEAKMEKLHKAFQESKDGEVFHQAKAMRLDLEAFKANTEGSTWALMFDGEKMCNAILRVRDFFKTRIPFFNFFGCEAMMKVLKCVAILRAKKERFSKCHPDTGYIPSLGSSWSANSVEGC
ncbi:hypothetical protein NE237_032004 [Protea cynaroides]|uniref:Uncharacterized protein n=1 Tax=Protea cynaroides TaxID=273540 RepID=A0A9Q0L2H2_9MAGN|nr:hypothetical protein NE237_032004 [Protea cynaroides]